MKRTGILLLCIIVWLSCGAQDVELYFKQGTEAANAGEFEKAERFFTNAIRLDGNYPELWYNRALAKSKMKRYTEAIADYTRAIELDPFMAKAFLNRGADRK